MLLAAIDHVKRQGGDPRTFFGKIYGQEKNLTTSSVARMNLVLHGIEDFQIAREDTLRNPAFTDGAGGLAKFDCVIANPPFSLKEWGRDIWENDPWGRTQVWPSAKQLRRLRLRPAHDRVDGRGRKQPHGRGASAGCALPQGRRGQDPRGPAQGRPDRSGDRSWHQTFSTALASPAAWWSFAATSPPKARKNKVLIIDAQSLFRKGRAQNFLDPEHGEQIVEWFQAFEDVEDRAKVVSLDEIKDEGWTLNISRYVLPPIGEDIPPLPEAVAAFKDALNEARASEDSPANRADRRRMAAMSDRLSLGKRKTRSSSRTCANSPRCYPRMTLSISDYSWHVLTSRWTLFQAVVGCLAIEDIGKAQDDQLDRKPGFRSDPRWLASWQTTASRDVGARDITAYLRRKTPTLQRSPLSEQTCSLATRQGTPLKHSSAMPKTTCEPY